MERETGLEHRYPNFALVSLTEDYQRVLDQVVQELRPSTGEVPSVTTTRPTNLLQHLERIAGTSLGKAVAMVLDAAKGKADRDRRRWGMKVLLDWSVDSGIDLGILDEVALRETYRLQLLTRYTQANGPMWVAHRLLEAIDAIRAAEPEAFPPLPPRETPHKAEKPRRPRGTDLVHGLAVDSIVARAAHSVVNGAPSPVQKKVRRYALGQLLLWCEETGRAPDQLTFEEIDGSFLPWAKGRVTNWSELGVHARKMVKSIAATTDGDQGGTGPMRS